MIQKWESGYTKPTATRLQSLLQFYLQVGVFVLGSECEEARKLWQAVKDLFDQSQERLICRVIYELTADRPLTHPTIAFSPRYPQNDPPLACRIGIRSSPKAWFCLPPLIPVYQSHRSAASLIPHLPPPFSPRRFIKSKALPAMSPWSLPAWFRPTSLLGRRFPASFEYPYP
jgi:hypothetical protein